jgi:hypothetical protein
MYDGLGALVRGAIAALVLLLPALILFWRLSRGLAAGPRALRPFLACVAAYGAISGLGAMWFFAMEPGRLVDEALAGLMFTGALALLIAFLVLLLFPRPSAATPPFPER